MTTKHSWHDSVIDGNARKAQHWKYERGKMSTEVNVYPLFSADGFAEEQVKRAHTFVQHKMYI